jgi:uncharacterized protein (TIGR03032 family)
VAPATQVGGGDIEGHELDELWSGHDAQWRDPAQVTTQWPQAHMTDPKLLRHSDRGAFWDALEACGITLLVSREYEHLLIALTVVDGRPRVSYMPLAHPSGLAVHPSGKAVFSASTRNPNAVYEFRPVEGTLSRLDVKADADHGRPLLPVGVTFYPGCFYMHDMAFVGGELHANAVGSNCVVKLEGSGRYERVWWPRCIDTPEGPLFGRNQIQLNSIAAGEDLESSFFSASADRVTSRRPGQRNFPVDKRGVIFSGRTREAVARGLTRPHSARLHKGRVWVCDSGYGRVGCAGSAAKDDRFEPVVSLPGWTRGMRMTPRPDVGHLAFVGTSRVIPRFRAYAPGLDVDKSVCGVHAVDTENGEVMGSLIWPYGNQIFAVESISREVSTGFALRAGGARALAKERALFYSFLTEPVPKSE